jgi:hypothetical protein
MLTKGKKLYLWIIVSVILFLGIWSIILDFSRFSSLNFNYDIYPSALLKRINVILAAIIAWTAGKDRLSLVDNRRMKAAFMFICIGEAAFASGWRAAGICSFAICQTLLIIRNCEGLRKKLKYASQRQRHGLVISSIIVFIIFAATAILFSSINKAYGPAFIAFIYILVLSTSLWAGLTSNILGLFPLRNSRMAAIGMISFYCCDVLVGLDAVLVAGVPWLLANSFIWIFYIPALTLLALSSYRYD